MISRDPVLPPCMRTLFQHRFMLRAIKSNIKYCIYRGCDPTKVSLHIDEKTSTVNFRTLLEVCEVLQLWYYYSYVQFFPPLSLPA